METNPIKIFSKWYGEELESSTELIPSACCLSTNGLDGYPNARFVSLKEIKDEGFIITGALNTRKGIEIAGCPKVALTFWWTNTQRQVRMQGEAKLLSSEIADTYFDDRPVEAQIVSIISNQGQTLNDVQSLQRMFDTFERPLENKSLPPALQTGVDLLSNLFGWNLWSLKKSGFMKEFYISLKTINGICRCCNREESLRVIKQHKFIMLFNLFYSFRYVALLAVACPVASLFTSCSNNGQKQETKHVFITEDLLSYFSNTLINKTKASIADYDKQGLAGGVDGFNLRKVYPELEPHDFTGVRGKEGDYAVKDGELNFTGNAASTSAVLTKEGFKTLLDNCSKRMKIPVTNRRDIESILSKLSGNNMTSSTNKPAAAYLMDAMYKKFIPTALEDYIFKNHPDWSLPERYRWHPKLFDKYRTDSTVPPVISGDFDCNGKRDYALLMDKKKKGLAVMLFLGDEQSFSSKILTENLVHDVPRIEYVLTVVKPGVYKTIDPDIVTDPQSVRLQCASVGIGLFKELYDSSRDVYYFANGELRSCLMEN